MVSSDDLPDSALMENSMDEVVTDKNFMAWDDVKDKPLDASDIKVRNCG